MSMIHGDDAGIRHQYMTAHALSHIVVQLVVITLIFSLGASIKVPEGSEFNFGWSTPVSEEVFCKNQ
jgi:hypothetical protein